MNLGELSKTLNIRLFWFQSILICSSEIALYVEKRPDGRFTWTLLWIWMWSTLCGWEQPMAVDNFKRPDGKTSVKMQNTKHISYIYITRTECLDLRIRMYGWLFGCVNNQGSDEWIRGSECTDVWIWGSGCVDDQGPPVQMAPPNASSNGQKVPAHWGRSHTQ